MLSNVRKGGLDVPVTSKKSTGTESRCIKKVLSSPALPNCVDVLLCISPRSVCKHITATRIKTPISHVVKFKFATAAESESDFFLVSPTMASASVFESAPTVNATINKN